MKSLSAPKSSKPTPTPSGVTRPIVISVPGISGGSSSSVPTPEVVQDGVLWNPGGTGPSAITGNKSYKSKSSAEALFKTGTLPKSQMDMINNAYAKYGKSMGFQKASSFWAAIVDSSDSSTSPFQIISQMNAETAASLDGGTGAGGGTSTNVSIQQYDKSLSDTLIDSTLLSTFGRKATDAEKNRFFKELNKLGNHGV